MGACFKLQICGNLSEHTSGYKYICLCPFSVMCALFHIAGGLQKARMIPLGPASEHTQHTSVNNHGGNKSTVSYYPTAFIHLGC